MSPREQQRRADEAYRAHWARKMEDRDMGTIHDQFCRCRVCKPPMTARMELEQDRGRCVIAAMILGALGIIFILALLAPLYAA